MTNELATILPAALPPDSHPLRVGVLDGDRARAARLHERLTAHGWSARAIPRALPATMLPEQRLHALVLDRDAVADPWSWLATAATALPRLGIVVTADRSTVQERVRALGLGADDWVTRPYDREELLARVEAVLRGRQRPQDASVATPLAAGGLVISPQHRQAYANRVSARLRGREFSVLHALASEAGRVVSREQLYERVWGCAMVPGDRSVAVQVCHVRQKLAQASPAWQYIHTHHRIGYRFEPVAVELPQALEAAA